MSRYLLKISLLICFIIIGFFLFKPDNKKSQKRHSSYKLSSIEKAQLQTGDIILRRGFGLVSTMILRLMNEKHEVTHIGVIINQNDSIKVAHALSSSVSNQDGLRFQNLDDFIYHSHDSSVIVSRLKNIDSINLQKVFNQLEFYLEKQLPFDHKFDYSDTTEHYCSELIWRIYENKLKILKVSDSLSFEKKYNTLNIFYDTSYFDILINHQKTI